MFKRTTRLLKEHNNEDVQQVARKVIDKFTPNDHVLNKKLPFVITGEHLPRTKINPYKKAPLRVIYDHEDFASFVLPSRRSIIYHSNSLILISYFKSLLNLINLYRVEC